MTPIQYPSEEEVRAAYQRGEEAVLEIYRQMIEMLMILAARINTLEDRLAKDSHNSGKPPSSDGLNKPSPKSLRKRHGRKSGGQPGHTGHTLKMVANPNCIEVHRVRQCIHCKATLEDVEASHLEKRQVFDLPKVQVEGTERQATANGAPPCVGEDD